MPAIEDVMSDVIPAPNARFDARCDLASFARIPSPRIVPILTLDCKDVESKGIKLSRTEAPNLEQFSNGHFQAIRVSIIGYVEPRKASTSWREGWKS